MSRQCPGCDKPMIEGQVFNGLYGCHWDCAEVVRKKEGVMKGDPALSKTRTLEKKLFSEVREGIAALEAENAALKEENRELRMGIEAPKHSRRLIAELKEENAALRAELGKT